VLVPAILIVLGNSLSVIISSVQKRDAAWTLLNPYMMFNTAEIVSGEPTVINCPVTGR